MTKTKFIEVQCPQCGHYEFENLENLEDDDFAKCSNCHFEIMLADLKEVGIQQAKDTVISEVKAEVDDIFKNAFKGLK